MANKTQPEWVQKFIDHTHEHGRLTVAQAVAMTGFTRRTLQHYLADAVKTGGLYRTPKQGIFVDISGYRCWLAKQYKARELAKRRKKEAAEAALDAIKGTPYNPELNVICRECRNSPAMMRVLSFYGATQ